MSELQVFKNAEFGFVRGITVNDEPYGFRVSLLRTAAILLQSGLRKKIVETVKISAKGDFDKTLCFAEESETEYRKSKATPRKLNICIDLKGKCMYNNIDLIGKQRNHKGVNDVSKVIEFRVQAERCDFECSIKRIYIAGI